MTEKRDERVDSGAADSVPATSRSFGYQTEARPSAGFRRSEPVSPEALSVVIWVLATYMNAADLKPACDHLASLPVAEEERVRNLIQVLRELAEAR